ncbi:MAG TPA: VOC family protein [Steroidobacteraceae bacterium]|nr:VOC family protein [Steroidobacteraceae bacterium]
MSRVLLCTFAVSMVANAQNAAPRAAGPRPPITGVSHIAVYASDPLATEHFYVHDLGATRGADPENSLGVRYYFSTTQFVEVLPLPKGPASINRLDHVAFATSDAEGLRHYLAEAGIRVPQATTTSPEDSWFEVQDPEGNLVQFVQARNPPSIVLASRRLADHIIHFGFIVHDRDLEDGFYRKLLGFRPYWFGGNEHARPTWISQQVPDGRDWLEYMLVDPPRGRGIPAGMSQSLLGIFNHFSLGVTNMEAAYTRLWNEDRLTGQDGVPKIGRDAKWQLNLHDADQTRAEIMELHAIGKPCCSPFTAPDPLR